MREPIVYTAPNWGDRLFFFAVVLAMAALLWWAVWYCTRRDERAVWADRCTDCNAPLHCHGPEELAAVVIAAGRYELPYCADCAAALIALDDELTGGAA